MELVGSEGRKVVSPENYYNRSIEYTQNKGMLRSS